MLTAFEWVYISGLLDIVGSMKPGTRLLTHTHIQES